MKERIELWKWVAGVLVGVVMFLAGSLTGASASLDDHEKLLGHPTSLERIAKGEAIHDRDIAVVDKRLENIDKKLDTIILLLRDGD